MTIANCKRCGRIYNRVRRDICPACIAEEDQAFALVRAYLHDHRDAMMEEVVEATDVPIELIISMIQDGRLILRDNPNLVYTCENCGGPTQAGRFCANCTQALSNDLQRAGEGLRGRLAEEKKDAPKGYYSK